LEARKAIDKFGRYLGTLDIEVDGEKLELDVRLKDKHKIMSVLSKAKDSLSEEHIEKLSEIFRKILYRSYLPYWDSKIDVEPADLTPEQKQENDKIKQGIDAFMIKKFEAFMTEISIAFGWTTRQEIETRLRGIKKNLEL